MDPLILIVAADPVEGGRLLDELGRYRRDYKLEVVSDGAETTARLAEVAAAGGSVAMVLADLALGASDGMEVLTTVRGLSRTTRCVLLLEWGLRGDRVTVQNIAFDDPLPTEPPPPTFLTRYERPLQEGGRILAVLVIAGAGLLFLKMMFGRAGTGTNAVAMLPAGGAAATRRGGTPRTVAELENEIEAQLDAGGGSGIRPAQSRL